MSGLDPAVVSGRIRPLVESLELDTLLDTLTAINSDIKHSNTHYDARGLEKWKKYNFDELVAKFNEARIGLRDFTILKPLARGAFGEVSIAKCNLDGKIYALKKQRKADMLAMLEKANFMEEKLILCSDDPSPWLTQIHSAFQTEDAIYLAMEFMAGGDIMSLCIRADETNIIKLDEKTVRFYIAEVVLALQALHERGWVHRDVKPENLLLDATGHVKLADFGSCARLNERALAYSAVAIGSPDYISPEILASEGTGVWHGIGVDIWSLGITLYEMLFGDVPFSGDTLLETNSKISQHQKYLKFSAEDKAKVSADCIDLIKQMITDKATRIGNAEGMTAVRRHPWFKEIDWNHLRESLPPFVPTLSSPDDISNFDLAAMEDRSLMAPALAGKSNALAGSHLPFVGYSHTPALRTSILTSNAIVPGLPADNTSNLKQKITALEADLLAARRILETDKNKMVELEKSIMSYEAEIRAGKRALEKEKIGTEELGKQRAIIDREKMRLEVELKDFKRKLHVESVEKDSLSSKLSNLTAEFDREKRKQAQVSGSIPDMEATIASMEKKIEMLKSQLTEQISLSTNQETSLSSATKEKNELTAEITLLKKQLDSSQAAIDDFVQQESQLKDTADLLKNVETELEEAKAVLLTKEAELAALKAPNANTDAPVSSKPSHDDKDKVDALPAESLRTSRSRTMSNSQSEKTNGSDQMIVQLKNEVNALKAQIHDLITARSELEEQSNELAAKLRIANLERQQQQLQLLDATQAQEASCRALESLRSQLDAQEKDLVSANAQKNQLTQELSLITTQMQTIQADYATLIGEAGTNSTRLHDLEVQLSQMEENKRISEDETLALMSKYQRSMNHVDSLTERNIEMSNLELSLKTKIEELHAENQKISERYDLETSKLKSQHEKDKMLLSGMVEKMTRELRIEPLPSPGEQPSSPGTPNSPLTSPKRYRFQKNVLQKNDLHLRDEISKRQDLEAEFNALKAAKAKLEAEFEEYRLSMGRKSPSVQTSNSDSNSPKSPSALSRNFFRPLKIGKKLRNENEIGPILFSGWLKVRMNHTKAGAKADWLKKFFCIRDGQVQIYDKEKDAELSARSIGIVPLGNDIFLVRRAHPHEYIHNTPKEIACMFLLFATKSPLMQSKLSFSTTSDDQELHRRLGNDQLVDLTEKLTKITDKLKMDEEQRALDEKTLAQHGISKEAKAQTTEHLKDLEKSIKNLLRERLSYEQFAKNAGLDLEEMMRTVEHKAKLLQQKRRSLSVIQAEQDDLTDLYEVNAAIAEWEGDLQVIEKFVSCVRNLSSKQDADNQTRLARDIGEAEHTADIIRAVSKIARERGKGSSNTSSLWNINRYTIQTFGTHSMVFREQEVGSLCNHCFNALFGIGQTLQCLECKFACHKNCAKDVTSPTCDEHKELSKLQPYVLLASEESNRQAWMEALEACRASCRLTGAHTDRMDSQQSLYHSAQASSADLDAGLRHSQPSPANSAPMDTIMSPIKS